MLAYKFRVENGVYEDDRGTPHESFVTLKKLEHLFESVAIQLPARRRLWGRTQLARRGLTFGSAVCRAAVATAPTWCDDCVPTVRAVVRYLGGPAAAGLFDAGRQADSAVERRVLATVPYVRSLCLVDDQFFLVAPSSTLDRQLRDRITAVDERLTVGGGVAAAVRHPTAVTDAYASVRDICIDVGLIRRGDPELPERPPLSPADVVPLLRHLLRLACGTTAAARRTDGQRFTRLVTRLHDQLIDSVDAADVRAAERHRDGMDIVTRNLAIANRSRVGCAHNTSRTSIATL